MPSGKHSNHHVGPKTHNEELMARIVELRQPPHNMSLLEIARATGVGKGRVAGLYYRNLSKHRHKLKATKTPGKTKPAAPRRFSWESDNDGSTHSAY
jgi:hypothetical protein